MIWKDFLGEKWGEILLILLPTVIAFFTLYEWDLKDKGKGIVSTFLLVVVIFSVIHLKKSFDTSNSDQNELAKKNSKDSALHIAERILDSVKYADQKRTSDSNFKLQIELLNNQISYGESISSIKFKSASIINNLSALEKKFIISNKELYSQQLRQDYLLDNDISIELRLDIMNTEWSRDIDSLILARHNNVLYTPIIAKFIQSLHIYFDIQSLHLLTSNAFQLFQMTKGYVPSLNEFTFRYDNILKIFHFYCPKISLEISPNSSHSSSILDYENKPFKVYFLDQPTTRKFLNIFPTPDPTFFQSDSVHISFKMDFSQKKKTIVFDQGKNPNFSTEFNFQKLLFQAGFGR